MGKYILSLDSGTTSNRAILFDRLGNPVHAEQREFRQIFPKVGWVEHDPMEIWETQLAVGRDILKKNRIDAGEMAAIGITNQRETTLLWDRETGIPVYHAIVWQDRRTAGFCNRLKKNGFERLIREKTGLVIDAYFSASKIRWILDHVKGVRDRAEKGEIAFGTIDSWLVWKLTGGKKHVTDASNASRTMLYNIHSLSWDHELLEIFKIPQSILPEVVSNSENYGPVDLEHFGEEIPVAGMAGDQQAALFGQMCVDRGMVKNTYGTGCFVVMNTGSEAVLSRHNLLTTIGWEIDGRVTYALEGSIFIAGAAVQWLRDKLKIIKSSGDLEELALRVQDSGGVYFVPAFVGLGAPHWDPYATGTIIGINRDTSDAHIARAALEAIALQSRDVIHTMEKDSGITLKQLRVDGGAAVNDLLMQIQADLLRKDVVRPVITETTAFGAACLAGLAVGFWQGMDDIREQWKMDRIFSPAANENEMERLIHGWERALDRSRNWHME